MTATVASEVYKAAQPALLYLVPFTLLPILVMAYLKVLADHEISLSFAAHHLSSPRCIKGYRQHTARGGEGGNPVMD